MSDPHITNAKKCSQSGRRRFPLASRKKHISNKNTMSRRLDDDSTKYMRVGGKSETCVEVRDDKEERRRYSDQRSPVQTDNIITMDKEDEDSGISEVGGEESRVTLLGKDSKLCGSQTEHTETLPAMIVQIVLPFFLAGFGMMAAGLLLDAVQVSMSVYLHCSDLRYTILNHKSFKFSSLLKKQGETPVRLV